MKIIDNAYAALPSDIIIESIKPIEKCSFSGVVEKVKIEKNTESECVNNINIYAKSGNGYFILKSTIPTDVMCDISFGYGKNNYPKEGTIIDSLLNKYNYYVLTEINKDKNGKYVIYGETLEGKFETCTPNSSFIEQNSNYLYYGILICTLIIIGIIVNMFLKKKIK